MSDVLHVKSINGMDLIGYDDEGHNLLMSTGGEDGIKKGVAPMEGVLYSLAGCTGMDVIAILKKKKNVVENFQMEIRYEKAEKHPKVYTYIDLLYIVDGEQVRKEDVIRSIELSATKFCSVSSMLKRGGVKINYRARINGEDVDLPDWGTNES